MTISLASLCKPKNFPIKGKKKLLTKMISSNKFQLAQQAKPFIIKPYLYQKSIGIKNNHHGVYTID